MPQTTNPVDAVRSALATPSTCSASTTTALQSLLSPESKQPAVAESKATATKATTARKTATAKNAKTKQPTNKAPSNATKALSPREKHKLATDVVNTALKVLTEASRSPPPNKASSPSALSTVAECARIAFAHLRAARVSNVDSLQLETGMLALVGKLIAHGLDTLATKELRVLKTCLQQRVNGRNATSASEKETLASLLHLECRTTDTHVLSLANSYHISVLRLIAKSCRPATIEAAVEYLDPSNDLSPTALVLQHLDQSQDRAKAAKQLDSFSRLMLSACPNPSSSADLDVQRSKDYPSPDTVFKLQTMALLIQTKWWDLAGHQANLEKDFYDPLTHYLDAYRRRSTSDGAHTYKLAIERLGTLVSLEDQESNALPPSFAIYNLLSLMAESAAMHIDAMRFTDAMSSSTIHAPDADLRHLLCNIRTIDLRLDRDSTDSESPSIPDQLQSCKSDLKNIRSKTSTFLDELLVEISRLRKTVVKSLTAISEDQSGSNLSGDASMLCALAFFCTEILVWYFQRSSTDVTSRGLGSKMVIPFVSSNLFTCKFLASGSGNDVEMIQKALQDCSFLIKSHASPDCQRLLVNVSNLYWRCFQLLMPDTQSPAPPQAIQCLQASVDILRSCAPADQEAGFLTTKLERLASFANTTADSRIAYTESVRVQLASGILRDIAKLTNDKPLSLALEMHSKAQMLQRNLRGYHNASSQADEAISYYDDDELDSYERAILLEMQLTLFEDDLLKPSRRARASPGLQKLCARLLQLYESHPLLRARIYAQVLRYSKESPEIFDSQIKNDALEHDIECESLHLDKNLGSYVPYLKLSLGIAQTLHSNTIPVQRLADYLDKLSTLINFSNDWVSLRTQIDDVNILSLEVQTIASYTAMQGKDEIHLKSLQLLAQIHSLQPSHDPSTTLQSFSNLALQYLRMGYSSAASQTLEKGELHAKHSGVSSLAKLEWHLANAEVWVSVGKIESATKSTNDAAELSRLLPRSEDATKHQILRVRAQLAYVCSLVSRDTSLVKEAMLYAKRYVALNQNNLSYLERASTSQSERQKSLAPDAEEEGLVKAVDNLTISGSTPPPQSRELPPLRGAAFWALVPDLLRSFLHLSDMYAHQGMRAEASYYLEQASKLVSNVNAPELRTRIIVQKESQAFIAGGGVIDPGNIEDLDDSINLVRQGITRGDVFTSTESWKDAQLEYEKAEKMAVRLASKTFKENLDPVQQQDARNGGIKAAPARKTAQNVTKALPARSKSTKSIKNPVTKARAPLAPIVAPAQENVPLLSLCAASLRQRGLLLMTQGQVDLGLELLGRANTMKCDPAQEVLQQIAMAQGLIFKFNDELALDFTFNVLPESTISYPALSTASGKKPQGPQTLVSSTPVSATKTSSPKKAGRQKRADDELVRSLCEAQERIMTVQHRTASRAGMSVFHQLCGLGSKAMLLLSAINAGVSPSGSLHPTRAACSLEMPRIEALSRELSTMEAEKGYSIHENANPISFPAQGTMTHLSASRFQRDYIDVIPDTWTAVSLTLSEDLSELYIARYRARQAPFLLRLPMTRNKMQDLEDGEDAGVFDFASGKAELQEIIELSNYSCSRTPVAMSKEAKLNWWDEREALDLRMQELLTNIENIWLGGFRGVLSQHRKDPALLARFRKSLEGVLDRHLPSRQGTKSRSKKLVLDSNILELFVGLGNDQDGEVDLDEQILDLLYFVIDVLQFNGERNAYDEVDFDSIATETLDALRSYHEAISLNDADQNHLILILDRKLHAFPWESMPCLQGVSVSRVGSMLTLRERILAMRRQMGQKTEETYSVTKDSGAFILNPSQDLSRTQATLGPLLDSLAETNNSTWQSITSRVPAEKEIAGALSKNRMLLYFGHGSGNQYIRNRTIRKLDKCSEVVWLMGCSSGKVTENGDYEPTSVPLSYLVAGNRREDKIVEDDKTRIDDGRDGLCMAVVATLWDVTDKDIDRFSVKVGEEWGLWLSASKAAADVMAPKTPRKRGRSAPKTPSKTPSRTPARSRSHAPPVHGDRKKSLVEAVAKSRDACHMRYLNGAATVVYGVPVYLDG